MAATRTEVASYRLHVKTPGTDRLRKGASGQLRHLMATGWHETERRRTDQYVTVRMERTRNFVSGLPTIEGPRRRVAR